MANVSVPFNVSNFTSLHSWLQLSIAGWPSWAAQLLLPGFLLAVAFGIWLRTNNSSLAAIWLLITSSLALGLASGYLSPSTLKLMYFMVAAAVAWVFYMAVKQ